MVRRISGPVRPGHSDLWSVFPAASIGGLPDSEEAKAQAVRIATPNPVITSDAIKTQQPSIRPTLRCRPDRLNGMPIDRESFDFAPEIPKARFHENEKPNLRRDIVVPLPVCA